MFMICYLVLHYKNLSDTKKCIQSIMNISTSEDKILIVDNGSGDHSGSELKKIYKNNQKVSILILEQNLGFSKGNNIGYEFLRSKYDPDFIVVTNNDVVFHQETFQNKIREIYNEKHFYILGPDVYIPRNDDHQNPLFKKGISIPELEKEILEYENYEKNPKTFKRRLFLHKLKRRIYSNFEFARKLDSLVRNKDEIDYKLGYENVGLQGSCLIVSTDYITKEAKLFDPEPFLYCEEIFLYYKCLKKKYKTVYSPEIAIRHEEAASFKKSNKNELDRIRFMLKHHVLARKMLLEYLQNDTKQST